MRRSSFFVLFTAAALGCADDAPTTPMLDASTDLAVTPDQPATDQPATDRPPTDQPAPDSATPDAPAPTDVPRVDAGLDAPAADVPAAVDAPADTTAPPDAPTAPTRRLMQVNESTGRAEVFSVDADGAMRSQGAIAAALGAITGHVSATVPAGAGRDAFFVSCQAVTSNTRVLRIAGETAATATMLSTAGTLPCRYGAMVAARARTLFLFDPNTGMASTYALEDAGTLRALSSLRVSTTTDTELRLIASDGAGAVEVVRPSTGAVTSLRVSAAGEVSVARENPAATVAASMSLFTWVGGSRYLVYNYGTRVGSLVSLRATGEIDPLATLGDIGQWAAMVGYSDGYAALYTSSRAAPASGVARFADSAPFYTALGGVRADLPGASQPFIFALP